MTFLPQMPRYEPKIIDHSAAKEFKDCHRRYFYKYVLGKQPVESQAVLVWGNAYHKFREVLENTKDYAEAMIEGRKFWEKAYPFGVKEDEKKDMWRTVERLLKMFSKGFEYYTIEKQQNKIEVIGVEVAFNVELPNGEKISGRADQLVRWNGQLWGRDFKTTGKEEAIYKRTFEPNDQVDRYTYSEGKLSGEQVVGQIIEVMFNCEGPKTERGKKEAGPLIYTIIQARSKRQIDEWVKEQDILNEEMKLARGKDIWMKNENQCGWCKYHMVCTSQTEEGMMDKLNDSNSYVTRPWDNMRVDQITLEEKNGK